MRRIPVSVVGACRVGELNVFVIFVSSFSAEKEKKEERVFVSFYVELERRRRGRRRRGTT